MFNSKRKDRWHQETSEKDRWWSSSPSLTPAEEAMARTLEGRRVSCGIVGGIDTDGRFNHIIIIKINYFIKL